MSQTASLNMVIKKGKQPNNSITAVEDRGTYYKGIISNISNTLKKGGKTSNNKNIPNLICDIRSGSYTFQLLLKNLFFTNRQEPTSSLSGNAFISRR